MSQDWTRSEEFTRKHTAPGNNVVVEPATGDPLVQFVIDRIIVGGTAAGSFILLNDSNVPIPDCTFEWKAGRRVFVVGFDGLPTGTGIRYSTLLGGTHNVTIEYRRVEIPAPVSEPEPEPEPEPTPAAGWTQLSPSADTRKVYVSDLLGNDANDGLSEFTPKKTIAAGIAMLRSGFPDWLLLRAGDTWDDQSLGNWSRSGRNAWEPMVVSSYGVGARPKMLTGTSSGLVGLNSAAKSHLAFVGLHFLPHRYNGTDGSAGILWLCPTDGILFEDCYIEGYKDNFVVQNDNGPVKGFHIRRCIVVDAHSATSSHSQGIYAYGVDFLLIDECVFDHNGWKEGVGPATIYNHNVYLEECSNVVIYGNMFLRASSMGNKFCSNSSGKFSNIIIEDNFYEEGEIGISIGGNTTDALRFSNVTVKDNVMMHVGRTQPTGRDLAWYLEVKDWDGGLIQNNLMLHQSVVGNCYGINFAGQSERNITTKDNVFYGLISDMPLLQGESGRTGFTFSNNDWFGIQVYPEPYRDEKSYQLSLGRQATMEAFAQDARRQSKSNWVPAYTARAINAYARAGFGR